MLTKRPTVADGGRDMGREVLQPVEVGDEIRQIFRREPGGVPMGSASAAEAEAIGEGWGATLMHVGGTRAEAEQRRH